MDTYPTHKERVSQSSDWATDRSTAHSDNERLILTFSMGINLSFSIPK